MLGILMKVSCWHEQVVPILATSSRRQPKSAAGLSLEAKKDYLLKYIDSILPAIYRSNVVHDSTLQSMWKAIRTYHPYAVIFTAEGPGSMELKIRTGIYLFTIQAMLMFIMAVFFDLQVIYYSSCKCLRIMLIRHLRAVGLIDSVPPGRWLLRDPAQCRGM